MIERLVHVRGVSGRALAPTSDNTFPNLRRDIPHFLPVDRRIHSAILFRLDLLRRVSFRLGFRIFLFDALFNFGSFSG